MDPICSRFANKLLGINSGPDRKGRLEKRGGGGSVFLGSRISENRIGILCDRSVFVVFPVFSVYSLFKSANYLFKHVINNISVN